MRIPRTSAAPRGKREDHRIQNWRPLTVPLPDEDASEDGMGFGELLWKMVQASMGTFAGLLMGFFLGSIPGFVAFVGGDLYGLMSGYWGAILGMTAGAIIGGIVVWKDPS